MTNAPEGGDPARSCRRVALAGLIGSVIEAYDFVLYGLAAALVFPQVFFPSLGVEAGTVASLATLGVAFVARPVGAVFFGHFGDRLGRKKTLLWTVLGMGVGTALIGVIPSAATIGVAAPILIVVLRAVQGVAIGGEWAGAVLFVTEHAPRERRGLYAAFPQLGASLPVASATLLLVSILVSPETFISWGWRIPFVASALLVAVALYIRTKVAETPVFVQDHQRQKHTRPPLFEAFHCQPWTILRGAGVALTTLTFVYIAQSFVANYGVEHLYLSRNDVLGASALAGLFYAGFTMLSGVLSDKVGRRGLIGLSQILGAGWALLLFPVLDLGSPMVYVIALCVTMGIAGLPFGALGAFLPEQFPTRYRYTASGVSYQVAAVVGGGVAPLLAPVVVGAGGSFAFGAVLSGFSAIAALCTFSLRSRSRESMHWSHLEETSGDPVPVNLPRGRGA